MPSPARITSPDNEPDPRKSMQIAAIVRQQIDNGTLKPGGNVSITTLTQQHGVTRRSAAKGLQALVAEGRLALWPSYGYTVLDTSSHPVLSPSAGC